MTWIPRLGSVGHSVEVVLELYRMAVQGNGNPQEARWHVEIETTLETKDLWHLPPFSPVQKAFSKNLGSRIN
jgi:hypothetical protein